MEVFKEPREKKENIENILKESLKNQLEKMLQRNPERKDIKFVVLRDFLKALNGKSFKEAFAELPLVYKHAIITRLENEASHLGGRVPYEFIYSLSKEVYGVSDNSDGGENKEKINYQRKFELERALQEENKTRGIYR